MTTEQHKARCVEYLSQRRSTYDFRCVRYGGVIGKLMELGFRDGDRVVDVGAGSQDFFRCMQEFGLKAFYLPVDGSIDGTDLNHWEGPPYHTDFYVCIEVLEHLRDPFRMMRFMASTAHKGVVCTTPNSLVIDTLAIDPTHVVALTEEDFLKRRYKTEIRSFFCKTDDSILAWR